MERPIFFYSGPGLKISGVLAVPEGSPPDGRWPAVVLCAGPGTGRTPSLNDFHHAPRITARFNSAGYAVLRFFYRGVRTSEGPDFRLMPDEMVEDIRNAITFLQQQPDTDPARIGLFGATTGGANASFVAGVDERVKCVVSVSALGDCGRWQRGARRYWEWGALLKQIEADRVSRVLTGKSALVNIGVITGHSPDTGEFHQKLKTLYPDYKITERLISLESVEAILRYRPESVAARIAPRAAMWIRAGEDMLVPVAESQSLYDVAGEPKRLVTIPGKAHEDLYFDDGFDAMMSHAGEWFGRYL